MGWNLISKRILVVDDSGEGRNTLDEQTYPPPEHIWAIYLLYWLC